MGRKKKPHYRIVVADSASPRDGRFVETLGYYKPLSDPARLVLDLERVDHWISEGASPSGTVKSLISKARRGGDAVVAVGEVGAEERKAKRAEELATRRAAEKKAVAEKKATEEAAAAPAAAEAKAAEAAVEEAAAEEAAAEEAADAPEGEAESAPEAAAESEPEAEAAPEAAADEAPAAEGEEAAPEVEEDEEKKSE
jgi:small subunit ribosomal protein S16